MPSRLVWFELAPSALGAALQLNQYMPRRAVPTRASCHGGHVLEPAQTAATASPFIIGIKHELFENLHKQMTSHMFPAFHRRTNASLRSRWREAGELANMIRNAGDKSILMRSGKSR